MESQLAVIEQSFDGRYSRSVREALDELPDNFTITDPCVCGHPIVFAGRGFLKMSSYSREEVVGRNGKIFQGPATSRQSVMEIREAIREERPIQISLLNYHKDGTPLWLRKDGGSERDEDEKARGFWPRQRGDGGGKRAVKIAVRQGMEVGDHAVKD